MRFLWLYQYMPRYNFDHFLHMDIAEAMNKVPGVEVKCYGPGLHVSNPGLTVFDYNPDMTLMALLRRFPCDAIIICTKSRMFANYLPTNAIDNTTGEIVHGEWLPRGFKEFNNLPKIVLEEDYHYEANDKWYKEVGVDAILQRHYVNVDVGNAKGGYGVKHTFHPFSVDTSVFYDKGLERINKIKYTGSTNTKYYLDRVAAIEVLNQMGFLGSGDQLQKEFDYIADLNRFTTHLSGQSKYYILPAKVFEIASCGSVLFTNANPLSGIQKVFADTSYVKWSDDYSDIGKQANKVITNKNLQKEIVTSAQNDIKTRHTHAIRTRELVQIVEEIKKWKTK